MAELADALDLGSSGESRAGSSPVIRIVEVLKNSTSFILCCISCCIGLKNAYLQHHSFLLICQIMHVCKLALVLYQSPIRRAA